MSSSSDAPCSSDLCPRDSTGTSHFLDPNYVDPSQVPEEPGYDRRPPSPVHLGPDGEWPPLHGSENIFSRPLSPLTVPREEKKLVDLRFDVPDEVHEIPLKGKERLCHWGFTSYEEKAPAFDEKTMRYLCYQEEVCPTTNRHHFQGYVQFFRQLRWRAAQRELGSGNVHMTRLNGTPEQNRAYCSKAESAVPNTFKEFGHFLADKDNGKRNELGDFIKDANSGVSKQQMIKDGKHLNVLARYDKFASLIFSSYANDQALRAIRDEVKIVKPWQQKVLKLLNDEKKHSRVVNWVYDAVGNSGKTQLADYLVANCDAFSMSVDSFTNMAFIWIQNVHEILVIDLCRSDRVEQGNKFDDKALYRFLEQIKNGSVTSGKYESRVVRFIPPKVLVLSNILPDMSAMSEDRWNIINISEEQPVQSGQNISFV